MLGGEFETAAVHRHKSREVDDLLVVTTPRETSVLGCLLLLVLAAVVWAAVGGVDRVVSFDGVIHRSAPDRSWRATLLVAPAVAQSIDSGMAARIEVVAPDGTTRVLQGEVILPAAAPLRQDHAARLPWPVGGARRIDIAVRDADAAALEMSHGSPSRVSISLGRQSIAGLLAFGPS